MPSSSLEHIISMKSNVMPRYFDYVYASKVAPYNHTIHIAAIFKSKCQPRRGQRTSNTWMPKRRNERRDRLSIGKMVLVQYAQLLVLCWLGPRFYLLSSSRDMCLSSMCLAATGTSICDICEYVTHIFFHFFLFSSALLLLFYVLDVLCNAQAHPPYRKCKQIKPINFLRNFKWRSSKINRKIKCLNEMQLMEFQINFICSHNVRYVGRWCV